MKIIKVIKIIENKLIKAKNRRNAPAVKINLEVQWGLYTSSCVGFWYKRIREKGFKLKEFEIKEKSQNPAGPLYKPKGNRRTSQTAERKGTSEKTV